MPCFKLTFTETKKPDFKAVAVKTNRIQGILGNSKTGFHHRMANQMEGGEYIKVCEFENQIKSIYH